MKQEHLPPMMPPMKAVPPTKEEMEYGEYIQNLHSAHNLARHLFSVTSELKDSPEAASVKEGAEKVLSSLRKLIEGIAKKQEEEQMQAHQAAVKEAEKTMEMSKKAVDEFEAKIKAMAKQAAQEALRDQTK